MIALTIVALAVALVSSAAAGELSTPNYGGPSGRASVTVVFPEPVKGAPLSFGIPVGQARSPQSVSLFDDKGRPVPADVTGLGDWRSQPARWALISCVLSSDRPSTSRKLNVEWGDRAGESKPGIDCDVEGARAVVDNGEFRLTLGPAGIESVARAGRTARFPQWRPAFIPHRGESLTPADGSIGLLYDGGIHKKIRTTSTLSESIELQQEFDVYAGSPFVRCAVRYINRTLQDVPLDGIVPIELALSERTPAQVGLSGSGQARAESFRICQRAFGWTMEGDGIADKHAGAADDLGEWVALQVRPKLRLMWVFPYFQEMAAGDDDLESTLSFDGQELRLCHYSRTGPEADVRLRETMARTLVYWLVVNPPSGNEAQLAAAVKAMPYVVCDREHLTQMGVFQERDVSHLFDAEVLEAALYFDRARVPRAEYPRCGRGTDPGTDKSGEGTYEVDLHAGGMVFGEVFQYFVPTPGEGGIRFYRDELGIGEDHIITGGTHAYRNGDIPLALMQAYLRTGDRRLSDFARLHTQLFADYGLSHAPPPSEGVGHYYCDWYGNPYVYQRFEGLLLGYLVTGEPWWFESAKAMADFCVRAWSEDHPCDASIRGGLGGVQTRSAYIAKMLLRMFEVTGERQYADTAIRLGEWAAKWQEPEGWWTMHPGTGREFRCTPIFAGYICQGLWPVYQRTQDTELKACLVRAADWYMSQQEDARGSNPGTFPNSYWYGDSTRATDPIRGNYATTSHAANILLQAYLATGEQECFYGANAAWVGVLNHQTPEGGIPLENDRTNSIWSHVMVESLPDFAATAERDGLPIVIGSKTGVPGTSFMGKGATWDGEVFTSELKYRAEAPVPLRVFFPAGKPSRVLVDGSECEFDYDAERRVARASLPPSEEFLVCKVEVAKGRRRAWRPDLRTARTTRVGGSLPPSGRDRHKRRGGPRARADPKSSEQPRTPPTAAPGNDEDGVRVMQGDRRKAGTGTIGVNIGAVHHGLGSDTPPWRTGRGRHAGAPTGMPTFEDGRRYVNAEPGPAERRQTAGFGSHNSGVRGAACGAFPRPVRPCYRPGDDWWVDPRRGARIAPARFIIN